ncbi:hypothetical protein XENTR_v10019376 [Xenopus tropicalis]|nr:hypothetical protein XENTR_v10019376 [Xenopus tropicalis]
MAFISNYCGHCRALLLFSLIFLIWHGGTPVAAQSVPSPVQSVSVSNITTTNVTLSWVPPNDINKDTYTYSITVYNGSSPWDWPKNISGTSTQVTGLIPGVFYTFSVFTVTSNGTMSSQAGSTSGTTVPSPVQSVSISNIMTTNVTLSWVPPNDINKDTYTYSITVYNGSTSWNGPTNISGTSTQVTGLIPGVYYTFSVFTVTSNGTKSSQAGSTSGTTVPSPVQSVSISNIMTTNVTLSWVPPNDINKDTYTYSITVSNGSSPWNGPKNISGTSTLVTGLIPGVYYTFSVFTVTSNGTMSSQNGSTSGTTEPLPAKDLTITSRTMTTLNLSWTPPNDINSNTYSYSINLSNGSTTWNITTPKNANSAQVTDLLPGVTYTISVYTLTSSGTISSGVDSIKGTTRPSLVTTVSIIKQTNNSVTISWTPPQDINQATYMYSINVTNSAGSWNVNSSTNVSSKEVLDLLPGVTYTFCVYTVTSDGTKSSDCSPDSSTTRPTLVKDVTVKSQTTDSVTLSWTTPNDINKGSYYYLITTACGTTTCNVNSTVNANGATVASLLPGLTYQFSVYTVTSDGTNSSAFASTSGTTAPNAPTSVSGNPVNTTALSVNWTPPNDLNKNNYTYTVFWQRNNESLNQSITSNTTIIGGLTAGNQYNVSVISVINNVPSVKAVAYLQTNPEVPGGFKIVTITNSSVNVSWTIPSGGSFSGIEINAVSGTSNLTKQFTGPSSEGILDGLIPGTAYNLILRSFSSYPSGSSGRISRRATTNNIITYSNPIIEKVQLDPNTVTGITCTKVGGGYQLKVAFVCPSGSYSSIKILADGNEKETIPAQNCSQGATVQSLQPATKYIITVETVADSRQVSDFIICYTDNVGVIVGSIFGVLLFLLVVGLIAYFVLRKRRGSKNPFKKERGNMQKINIVRMPSVMKSAFPDYYQRQHADSDFGFAEEYQQLSNVGINQSKLAAELSENRSKNRFTNVLPYDHSRVRLNRIDADETSDYINANYMPGYNSSKEFIASQGPLPNTSADFWRMIWENQVSTIVMLTNCMENGRVKCEHYWPLDYTPCTYGDITVTVTSEMILPDWTVRDFTLKHAKQQGNKHARHFHFTVWPDHGVPENTTTIVEFRNLVREYMDLKRSSGPTVVHCSAGVGRTGTLIALDYLIQKMEKEQRIGIYSFVQKMRQNRPLMVQTESQYVFLNKCMLDLIQNPPDENIYENQIGGDLIYENASVVRDYQKDNL